MKPFVPRAVALCRSGELRRRIQRAKAAMAACVLCPRHCRINRLDDETGFCRIGARAVVASAGPHFGEEPPLVGHGGSGTIFFSGCNLGCVFCQNCDISHGDRGHRVDPEELAAMMIALQQRGVQNINLVTPTHCISQILEALDVAIENGLRLPLVWNCGGYENPLSLRLLEGVVDVYMPDVKFFDPEPCQRYLAAEDYGEIVRSALIEMYRQAGDLELDRGGTATRGLLIRHLVMPSYVDDSRDILTFIAERLSPRSYVNIMAQYRPVDRAWEHPRISRRPTTTEYEQACRHAWRLGLRRGFPHPRGGE